MRPIPPELLTGPFTRERAAALGVSSRMLEGSRFVRIHPRVWRHRGHEMSATDDLDAAALALPAHARTTGITRIQQLGLDYGPRQPLRFVVPGDLHLALEGIFLHRTRSLPPTDEIGVTPAAAFVAYCARARVIDAIKVGDWLLHHQHLGLDEVRDLALAQLWRDGSHETVWVLGHLDARSRSPMESETRALVCFSGLPRPDVNVDVGLTGSCVIGDLVFRRWGVVVEYEGEQHQTDRDQYVLDLGRYAAMRQGSVAYVQVTRELVRTPRLAVGRIFQALVQRGYPGPAPLFDERWRSLFARTSDLIGRDRRRPPAVA